VRVRVLLEHLPHVALQSSHADHCPYKPSTKQQRYNWCISFCREKRKLSA